eukprot:2986419-Amphidinium_carterae.1
MRNMAQPIISLQYNIVFMQACRYLPEWPEASRKGIRKEGAAIYTSPSSAGRGGRFGPGISDSEMGPLMGLSFALVIIWHGDELLLMDSCLTGAMLGPRLSIPFFRSFHTGYSHWLLYGCNKKQGFLEDLVSSFCDAGQDPSQGGEFGFIVNLEVS